MRVGFLTALFFLGALFDWWWTRYLGMGGFAPAWLFVATVAVAALEGPVPAQVLGFGWGLMLDATAVHLFGAHALTLSVFAALVGRGRRLLDLGNGPSQVAVMALLSVLYALAYGALGLLFADRFLGGGWRAFAAVPLANGLAAPFVFAWLRRKQRPVLR